MEKKDYFFVVDNHPYRSVSKPKNRILDLYSHLFVGAFKRSSNNALTILNHAINVEKLRGKCKGGKIRLIIYQGNDVAIVTGFDNLGKKVGEVRMLVWPATNDIMMELEVSGDGQHPPKVF